MIDYIKGILLGWLAALIDGHCHCETIFCFNIIDMNMNLWIQLRIHRWRELGEEHFANLFNSKVMFVCKIGSFSSENAYNNKNYIIKMHSKKYII